MNSALADTPYLAICYRPRATIRGIVEADPSDKVISLVVVACLIPAIASWLAGMPVAFRIGATSVPLLKPRTWNTIYLFMLAGAPLLGVVMLYVNGALVRWAGSLLRGTAKAVEVRAALAWSMIPGIFGSLLSVGASATGAVHRPDVNQVHSFKMLAQFLTPIDLFLIGVFMAIALWGFIVQLKCVSEVHHFSAWRALGARLIAGFTVLGVTAVIAILVPLVLVMLGFPRS